MPPTICLNMIIRNEIHVIERCLASVRDMIQSWVIVDTGSSDGTQLRVRELLPNLNGELYERPWRDFATNRNEALALAKGRADYVLFMDADDELLAPAGLLLSEPFADGYRIMCESTAGLSFLAPRLVRVSLPWQWSGVLHEYVSCPEPHSLAALPRVLIREHFDGSRNGDPKRKYACDARLLEELLQQDPTNPRNLFYLAQSYRSSDQFEKAEQAYTRRIAMGGWLEEIWYSMYQLGLVRLKLSRPWKDVERSLCDALELQPARAEPAWTLAVCNREAGRHHDALRFAALAMRCAEPEDGLFVQRDIYRWRAIDEYAMASCHIGAFAEALRGNRHLLRGSALPERERPRVAFNEMYCLQRLAPHT